MFVGQSISYNYPAAIKRAQDALKIKKEIMQRDGRAHQVSKECLMFEDLLAKSSALSASSVVN